MFNKKEFKLYEFKNDLRIRYCYRMNQLTNTFWKREYVPNYRKISNKKVLNTIEANKYISSLIDGKEPFWVGRFGCTELAFIYSYLKYQDTYSNEELDMRLNALCNLSGFFPNDKTMGKKYAELILNQCTEMDVHGIWPLYMEDFFISHYKSKAVLTRFTNIEPYALEESNHDNILPWSHSLKGKKVLVIHPFEETIRQQYNQNRKDIFSKRYSSADYILPEFELKTLKAVQTIAGNKDKRFSTWFEALDWMVEQCRNIDFDVAIIGCGAYGFPLAYEIKKMGKGAIQMCGATQLLFGIMGNRWKDNESITKGLLNDSWVFPSERERIENQDKVENACYW